MQRDNTEYKAPIYAQTNSSSPDEWEQGKCINKASNIVKYQQKITH